MEYTLDAHPQRPWLVPVCALIMIATTVAAYSNSLAGPFIFDDIGSIVENPTITSLTTALDPPSGGPTVSGRPVLNLTLALNYIISGSSVRGYHITNLVIHLAAGLALFGLLRR